MKKFLSQIIIAILGLWFSTIFVPGVSVKLSTESNFFGINLVGKWQIFLILGFTLGLLNYFIKPILDIITLPLKVITMGLFSFVIGVMLIWVLDILFNEFSAPFLYPLLWTALIIWGLNIIFDIFLFKKN